MQRVGVYPCCFAMDDENRGHGGDFFHGGQAKALAKRPMVI